MPRTRSQRNGAEDSPLKSLSDTKKPRAPRKKKETVQPAPPQEPSPPASGDEQEQEGSHSKSQSPNLTSPSSPHNTSFLSPTSAEGAFGSAQVNRVDTSTQTDLGDAVNSAAPTSSENSLNQTTDNEPEEFRKLTRNQLIDLIIQLRASSSSSAAPEEAPSVNSKKRKCADDTEDTGRRTIRRRRESDSSLPTANTGSAREAMMSKSQTPSSAMASTRRRRPLPINRAPIQRGVRRPQSQSMRRFLLTAANVRMTEELDSDDDGIPIDEPSRLPGSSHLFPDVDSLKYISGNAERFRKTDPKDQETASQESVSPEHTSPEYASPQFSSPDDTSPVRTDPHFVFTSTDAYLQVEQQGTPGNSLSQTPETPRTRGWGLSALVNSVPRAISKFIPGLQQPAETAAASNFIFSSDTISESSNAVTRNPSTPAVQFKGRSQAPNTAPSKRASTEFPSAPGAAGPLPKFQPPRRKAHEREGLLQRKEAADRAREISFAEARKARESREHELNLRTPGSKRKRSPDVIPNPKGCSYGMDPAFFEDDSSDEESDVDIPESSSANLNKGQEAMAQDERPSKRARVSDVPDEGDIPAESHPTMLTQTPRQRQVSTTAHTPSTPATQILGDPHRARPYTGTMFANRKYQRTYYGGNVFSESQQHKAAVSQATSVKKSDQNKLDHTTSRQPSFAVPDDSDEGNDQGVVQPISKGVVDKKSTATKGKLAPSNGESSKEAEGETHECGPKTPNIFGQAFGKRRQRNAKGVSVFVGAGETGHPTKCFTPSAQTSNKLLQGSSAKSDSKVPTESLIKPQQSPSMQPTPSTPRPDDHTEKPTATNKTPVATSTESSTTSVAPPTASFDQANTTTTATPSSSAATEPTKPAAKAAVTWTQPPPARPTPAHALLPIANPSGPSSDEALARARSQAEKYKPKQPSGLRASSRLSTSTVGSDTNEDEDGMTDTQRQEVLDAINALPDNEYSRIIFPAAVPYPSYDPKIEDAVTADRNAMTSEQLAAEAERFQDVLTDWKIDHGFAV
ncbi:MAG: hypothetical protein M1835_003846 [Candelina submexicana]|nr:MAG: hypothetical protein M1835_003846 [Candelina submexicana]